jgi:hypothetical protein
MPLKELFIAQERERLRLRLSHIQQDVSDEVYVCLSYKLMILKQCFGL